ncbi:MAG: DNA-processing protein DprA [Defluviitaleaceae bacterium]|nr:DNA-processing protein DprA [Defluviitaleaceae bacterium]
MSDDYYLLWLSTLYAMGSRKQNALLEMFGSARALHDANEDLLRVTPGVTEQNVHAILNNRDPEKIKALIKLTEQLKMRFVSRFDAEFPKPLAEIPDPPVGVFFIGGLPGANCPAVAVIGSRRCSEYGLTAARIISKPLAAHGVAVISGMARGIDSMAHRGAIEGGGKTVAVLGCGADICYPAENRSLREEIIANGCVLSEYPPGTTPMPSYFPVRNRIISGLASITVVVEAGKKSGTLITVDQALDQGRRVMAVPGNITSKLSEGTNALLAEGAEQVNGYKDILDALGINEKADRGVSAPKSDKLAPQEKIVYDILTYEPKAFDEILDAAGGEAQTLHYLLTMLELKGYIKKIPGMRYIKNI